MALITLTTDLGLRDYYIPVVKGYIYSYLPDVTLVDITHQVKPFNMAEAAYILKNAYKNFPDKSIHLINIESNTESNDDYILVEFEKHFFIAKNNGLISLITDGQADQIIKLEIDKKENRVFPLKSILAQAACKLAKDFKITSLGSEIAEMHMISAVKPLLEQDMIRGMIVYIDNYGNAISNISRSHFSRYGKDKQAIVYFSRKEKVESISSHYSDVAEGDALCLFGSSGLLEIAINKGDASKLIGLQEKSRVLVEFSDIE
ncbi:MAG: SAM-dependent chlorinase/fluorinase [Bacteroidetes bacterium]|nr:SAM-dependent chlorinase/fluorinase [Bacteroidota bacterium]